MWEEVTQGGVLDLYSGMRYYEQFIPEGSKVLWRFNLRAPLTSTTAKNLEQKLKEAGVKDVRVTTGSPVLNIYFTKGFPWLTIIASLVLVIAVLIISWRLLIWLEEAVPGAMNFLLIGGIGIVGILLLREVTKTKRELVGGRR